MAVVMGLQMGNSWPLGMEKEHTRMILWKVPRLAQLLVKVRELVDDRRMDHNHHLASCLGVPSSSVGGS